MIRDLAPLTQDRHDVLIVGGGIHGLFAAYDAALRGLSVALVERGDFGEGLSFNHQRTIHGGLRSLQSGNIRKTRAQIRERRTWAHIAPHLLRPLPFLVGTYRWTKRSRLAIRAGFKLYDFVGRRRNAGVLPELHLPHARLESAAATKRLFPGVSESGLSGGAIWYDYQTRHPDRLTWTVALAARQAGAHLFNHVEAVGALKNGGRISGARVRDLLTGDEMDVTAGVTVLAAGSQSAAVMQMFGATGAPPLLRAMNMLLNRPARDIATAAPASSGRMLTAVPWRGFILVGTHQSDTAIAPGESAPPPEAVSAMLADVNTAFPRFQAGLHDIRFVQHGLVPADVRGGRADLLPEPVVRRHAQEGAAGLVSLIGVKYTTSREAAERTIDIVCAELGRPKSRCRTGASTLPHADIADVEGRLTETTRDLGITLDRDVLEHLASWYGTEAPEIVRYAAASPEALERVDAESPVIAAEILWAAEFAQAERLSDAVFRRTALGASGTPSMAAIARAADLMSHVHGWSNERRADEIARAQRLSAPSQSA